MTETPTTPPPPEVMRKAIVKILFLIFFAVLVPSPILSALGYGPAASFIGLAGVGAAIAVLTAGIRMALLATVIVAVFAVLLTFASVTWWTAALVMAVVAFVFGLTALKGWQSGFVSLAIALSFIASDGAQAVDPLATAAVVLGIGFLVWGAIVAGIARLLFRKPVLPAHSETRRTVIGYVSMLVVVTFVTQSLAIGLNLGHVGGWLVMTPFLVILPHIRDGFTRSLRRAAGTVVGFVVIIGLSELTTSHTILSAVGAVMFTVAIYAKFRRWNYFLYAVFLTGGIVILEGLSTSVTTVAEYRLGATLGAVAISLAAMAITTAVGRKLPAQQSG